MHLFSVFRFVACLAEVLLGRWHSFSAPLLRTRRQCEGRSVVASEAKALPLGAYVSLGTDELAGVGSVDVWNAFEKTK